MRLRIASDDRNEQGVQILNDRYPFDFFILPINISAEVRFQWAMSDVDSELRTNLSLMNEMFDSILRDANIPVPDVPDIDLTTSQDFPAIGELLLCKLSAIEKCCDTASASTQKKYDARSLRDKIAVKRRQLAELEAENAALAETAKRQERALRQMNNGGDDAAEAQQSVVKLRQQLAAAQKEIKTLEERRHGLLAENRRLKGQIQSAQKASAVEADQMDTATSEEELNATLAQLEAKQKDLEARRQREQEAYQRKMLALKDQKERLTEEKAELEQRLRDKQKELELIHSTASKSRFPPPPQIRRK
jgi:myosin heavy subunit